MNKIFVVIHDPAGDRTISFEGMDQATVQGLVAETGFTSDFITEAEYQASIDAESEE